VADAQVASSVRGRGGLAGLTPSGRAIVPAGWALYDFANTIFSFAVVSGAIGLWLTADAQFGERDGNFLLSLGIVASVGLNALVSPALGALSDRAGRRLPFLFFFTALCVVPTGLIASVGGVAGLTLFIIANFAYQAALIYYDATLATVSYPETRGRLSGIGVAIGYLGTISVGLLITVLDVPVADRFLLAAGLYALFAVPIFLVVRERGSGGRFGLPEVGRAFGRVADTIRHGRQIPGLLRFLVGRFFYTDAVNTIIVVMTVVSVRAMGLTDQQAILVLLSLTVVAIVASFGWGLLVDRIGPRRTLLTVLWSWIVGLVAGAASLGLRDTAIGLPLFLVAGAILGSGLGGVQVADRVFLMRLAPRERLGEFFGLYGLVGKGSQVIGQLLYGFTILIFLDRLGVGAYQLAVLSLLGALAVGLWLIRGVSDVPREFAGAVAPPERLSPAAAPLEPRA
jgi:UMF1 family MFS transporter